MADVKVKEEKVFGPVTLQLLEQGRLETEAHVRVLVNGHHVATIEARAGHNIDDEAGPYLRGEMAIYSAAI